LRVRNRLKKKDWIHSLQKANFAAKETNTRLKERLAALEIEYNQLQSFMNEQPMNPIAPPAEN
jgi:hypothetical protein